MQRIVQSVTYMQLCGSVRFKSGVLTINVHRNRKHYLTYSEILVWNVRFGTEHCLLCSPTGEPTNIKNPDRSIPHPPHLNAGKDHLIWYMTVSPHKTGFLFRLPLSRSWAAPELSSLVVACTSLRVWWKE